MDGRKLKEIQNAPRWIDDFEVPGMFIGVRSVVKEGNIGAENGAERLLPITSSPNQARMDSALLDAALVEVMVDRSKDKKGAGIGYMAPGDVFEVTQALGRGFSSLFSTYVGLLSALEEKRELLMIGYGANGIGSLRSALNWNPVMALATDQRMSFVLVAPDVTSAACVPEWDVWRENGVKVVPVYERPGDEALPKGEVSLESLLADNMFSPPERFNDLVKYPMECAVLMAGLPSSASTFLTKKLTEHGVSKERFLFCEFF